MWYDDFVKMADFDDKLKNLNEKVTSGKSKHLLLENELKNLQDKTEKLQTMIQVSLLVKASLSMMEQNFT